MKRFTFRLEKVLQYRRAIQEEKRRAFALAMQSLKNAEARLVFLKQEFESNKIRDLEIILVQEIHIRGAYNERLKREISEQLSAIQAAEEAVEAARLEYIEATKEAEVLEKLKERKRQAHHEEMMKLEEAILDEMVTQRTGYSAAKE